MKSRAPTGRILAGLVAIVIFANGIHGVYAQTVPSVTLETAQVITDNDSNPRSIHLEFGLTTGFVLSKADLLYRPNATAGFKRARLALDPALRYVTSIPYSETIEYFIRLTPERGDDILLGSDEKPYSLNARGLEKVRKHHMSTGTKTAIGVGAAVSIILAIIFGAKVKNKKGP